MKRIINSDHYKNYKEKSKNPVTKEIFESFLYGNGEALYDWRTRKPCSDFGLFQEMLHTIVVSACMMDIPHGKGNLYILKKKNKVYETKNGKLVKIRPIDWKKTKELGKRVFLDNQHTDEYIYTIKWDKSKRHFKNKTMYIFEPSRGFQRYISFMKKQNPQLDFLEYV